MKTSFLQEHIQGPLSFVLKNVSFKTQLPIVQHILLVAEKGQLRLATTNIETTTITTVPAKTDEEGGICVPSKLFMDLINSFPQGKTELTTKELVLTATNGRYKATLPGMDKNEFPPLPPKKETETKIDAKEFVGAVKSVLFAAATDEARPLLTGIKIKRTEDEVLFVATDGYRLALKRANVPLPPEFDKVIPGKALGQVIQISQEGKLEFDQSKDGQCGFYIKDHEVYTRAIEGEYPGFERIIPKSNSVSIGLNRDVFEKAVKAAALFAKDNANIVKMSIQDGVLVVSANTPQVGESKVEMEVEMEGDGGEIAFNSRFLLDFLSNVSAKELVFEMTGSLNPGVFKIKGDDSFLHIIMPVRIQTD